MADFWKIRLVQFESTGPIVIKKLQLQKSLKFDQPSGEQKGCKGPQCLEKAKENHASGPFSEKDEAEGKGVTDSICELVSHALKTAAVVAVACCSTLPNQCRNSTTCNDRPGVTEQVAQLSSIGWMKSV